MLNAVRIGLSILLCQLCAALAFAGSLESKTVTPDENAALQRGETIIEVWRDKTREDGAVDVFGAIDIMASPDVIWDMMLDCDQALLIVKAMRSCEILQSSPDGSWDIRKQKIKVGPLLPKSVSIFRSEYDEQKSIRIELISGNMKVQEGSWDLQTLGAGKTRVSYRAALQPKFPVPRGILKKGMRTDVPVILSNMRMYAEMAQAELNAPANSVAGGQK